MHIIIVGPAYPLRGGIAHFNALLAKELGVHHRVETVTFRRQYPSLLFPGTTQEETGTTHGVEAAPQLIDSMNPFNWIRVGRLIRSRRPDLLIFRFWIPFFGPCFGTIARVAARGTATKVVYICDNVVPHERRPFDRAFTRYAFGSANAFLVQSHAVERDLLAFWPDAVYRTTPLPLFTLFGSAIDRNEARRALGIAAPRVILFFGYVRRYKGLHVLLDALARLDRSAGIHALVVGEFYEDEKPYRDAIDRLGIADRVSLVPAYVPTDEVRRYFSAADVVVLPYLSATQSGIAQIALNFGRPVITTDVGGLTEVVREGVTGLVVPPADPDALADAIRRFYDQGLEPTLAEGVRRARETYSWSRFREAIEDLARPRS